MTATLKNGSKIWLLLLGLVLCSNFVLYHTNLGLSLLPEDPQYVVIGTLFDLVITIPVLFMLYKKKFDVKLAITLVATGCIMARFLIPKPLFDDFFIVTWVGIAAEIPFVILEFVLVITFARYLPKITKTVRESDLPIVFSFPKAVDLYVKKHPLIHMICSELLVYYYAFCSWKKKPREGITLYKNSNYIAFQIMLIHAIVVETIGIHWWLHEKSMILSIAVLILNIYSVIFFLGDVQALRLNPVYFDDKVMYISLGLLKRAEIRFDEIESIIEKPEVKKKSKDTIEFIAGDFETPEPQLMLVMKKPVKAVWFMALKKEYNKVAISSDSPAELKQAILNGIAKNKN